MLQIWYSLSEYERFEWSVGIVFLNCVAFREAVKKYAIAQDRNLKLILVTRRNVKG